MPDVQLLTFLQECIADNAGQTHWARFKHSQTASLDLRSANLSGVVMRKYDLAQVNLRSAVLEEADLTGANANSINATDARLARACLREVIFERAILTGSDLSFTDLSDARMESAFAFQASFKGANMIGADLAGADLREADLTDACLKYARLSGALLDGANVQGADMTGCVLDPDAPDRILNFDSAKIDDRRYRQMRNTFSSIFGEPDPEESAGAGLSIHVKPRKKPDAPHPPNGKAKAKAEPQENNGEATTAPDPETLGTSVHATFDLSTIEGCCAILEVHAEATMDQITKAFRKKAKIYHPDKVRHLNARLQELAAEEFRRLHTAYERLTRSSTRSLEGILWAEGIPRRTSPYEYTSAEYELLVRINPNNTSIIYNLAWKYFEEGRPFDAKVWFEKLLELNPNDADAQYNLIVVRLYLEVQMPLLGG